MCLACRAVAACVVAARLSNLCTRRRRSRRERYNTASIRIGMRVYWLHAAKPTDKAASAAVQQLLHATTGVRATHSNSEFAASHDLCGPTVSSAIVVARRTLSPECGVSSCTQQGLHFCCWSLGIGSPSYTATTLYEHKTTAAAPRYDCTRGGRTGQGMDRL